MFCIVAFIILSILGLFSATNRDLAREAMDCVFRRVTLRPCNTGFDEKMKAKILGKVLTRSEVAARLINKHFELISWVFFILLLGSSIWAVRGVYLFYVTGSCNGLNQSAFCVFDPTGANNQVSSVSESCSNAQLNSDLLTLKGIDLTGFPVLNPEGKDKIVFIGCYDCAYTRKAYPMILDLVKRYDASMTFLHYPVKEKTDYLSRVEYCVQQQVPDKVWALNEAFFAGPLGEIDNEAFVNQALTGIGVDAARVNTCVNDPKTEEAVSYQMEQIVNTNFYGTPTIFINGKVMVGPKPYRVYAIMLKGLFFWLR